MVPNLKDYSYTTSLNPLDKVSKRAFLALQWSVLGGGSLGAARRPAPKPPPPTRAVKRKRDELRVIDY